MAVVRRTNGDGSVTSAPLRIGLDRVMVAYLLGFVFVGLAASFSGPALSHLRDEVGTDDGGIAAVFAAQAAGYISGSLLAGRGLDHGHGHRRWTIAMLVALLAVVVVGWTPELGVMAAAFVVIGVATGVCDVSGNTLVVWSRPKGPGPALNALHLCFAIGTMLSPLVVDRSIAWTGSVVGVVLPLAILAVVCGVVMATRPAPVRTRLDTVARSMDAGGRGLHVAAVAVFFFAYVAMEVSFGGWIHSYTEEIGYGSAAMATGVTTMFGVGFVLGRLVGIPVSRVVSPGRIVAVCASLAVVSAGLFVVFDGPGVTLWVVTFLFAFAVGPEYASMMAFAESHLALSGRNTSMFVAASGLGALVMPWLVGQLFDSSGPFALPVTVFVMSLVCATAAAVAGALLTSGQRPPATSMIEPVT